MLKKLQSVFMHSCLELESRKTQFPLLASCSIQNFSRRVLSFYCGLFNFRYFWMIVLNWLKGSALQTPDSNAIFYVLSRAADKFHEQHGRYPGESDNSNHLEEDFQHLKKKNVAHLLSSLKIEQNVDDKYVQEIVRFGNCELHPIASFMGGVASQEAIKFITKQYIPLNNTFIYNGINSTTLAIEF